MECQNNGVVNGSAWMTRSEPADYHAEAADVLDQALQEIDSIMAEAESDLATLDESHSTSCSEMDSARADRTQSCYAAVSHPADPGHHDPVLQAVDRLKLSITMSQKLYGKTAAASVSDETRSVLLDWLRGDHTNQSNGCASSSSAAAAAEYDERLHRLEADKSSLQSQVSVLTELIDSQTEKIVELQHQVHTRQLLLGKAEDRLQKDLALQQELLQRSSFETQKLDLMRQLSSLTLQQRALQHENVQLRARLRQAETVIASRRLPLSAGTKRHQLPPVPPSAHALQQLSPRNAAAPSTNHTATNGAENGTNGVDSDDDHSQPLPAGDTVTPITSRHVAHLTSTPNSDQCSSTDSRRILAAGGTLPRHRAAPPSGATGSTDAGGPAGDTAMSGSSGAASALGTFRRAPYRGHSAWGHGLWQLVTGKHSGSAPNLAESAEYAVLTGSESPKCRANGATLSPFARQKSLRKLLGRLKRTSSGRLDGEECDDDDRLPDDDRQQQQQVFRRGGLRASAGPRVNVSLERVNGVRHSENGAPHFINWNTSMVVGWFHEMGLSAYTGQLRSWAAGGAQLASCSSAELAKQLGIKHPLHVKKLVLAVRAAADSCPASCSGTSHRQCRDHQDLAGHLDHNFVLRWLDDVGLPLYRDAFLEARVDGRVLDRLALADLQLLRVHNQLHVLSLRRGIQVLRASGFSVGCLRRRPTPADRHPPPPADVALWTNHRVMEWLREVDLAEYAANMRGSGVHGALFIHEPRFTGELLASVLAIPANKTLLRRHLYSKFNELIGVDVLKQKREIEEDPLSTPLRVDSKFKFSRRNQMSLRRRKSRSAAAAAAAATADEEELLCPLDQSSVDTSTASNSTSSCCGQQLNGTPEHTSSHDQKLNHTSTEV